MYLAVAAFGFTQGVFYVGYLVNNVHVASATATMANLIAAVTYLLTTLVGGWMADKISRRTAYIIGGMLIIPSPFIMFGTGMTGSVPIIFIGMAVVGAFTGIAYGAQAALFFEMFPAEVRYTGISIGFQIAAVLGGGVTPLLAQSLTQLTGSTLGVSLYICALAVALVVCTLASKRVIAAEKTQ
jgi:MHS family shikimate/dehydroshikimate transporter-like MFS transporter